MFDFIIYQDSTTNIDYFHSKFGSGPGIIMHLREPIKLPNYRIYFDNLFTSFNLLEWLHSKNIYWLGTSRENRFNKPPLKSENTLFCHCIAVGKNKSTFDADVVMKVALEQMVSWILSSWWTRCQPFRLYCQKIKQHLRVCRK